MAVFRASLGASVLRYRTIRGVTQAEVAEASGLTVNYLSRLENGQRGITFDTLQRIAEALRVPLELIVLAAGTGTVERTPKPSDRLFSRQVIDNAVADLVEILPLNLELPTADRV